MVLWGVSVALALYAASLRFGVTYSLSNGAAVDFCAGAVRFQLRELMPAPALGMPGLVTPARTPFEHQRLYAYRHHFGAVWWYEYYELMTNPSGSRSWTFPLWPLTALGAGLLAWRWVRRVPPGHCRACRYDLRGLSGGVCPECGTAVPAPGR